MCQLQKAELYLCVYVASILCFCNLSNSSSAWYRLGCYCLLLLQWYCPQINRIISFVLLVWFVSKSNKLQGKSDSRVTAEEIGNICNITFKIVLLSCHPPSRLAIRIRIITSLHVGHAFQEPFPDFTHKCSHWNKLTQMRDDCLFFSFILLLLTSWGNCLWKM